MRRTWLVATALAACAPSVTSPSVDAANVPMVFDSAVAVADATVAAYPAGPYGHNPGEIIAPLEWQGYVDAAADAVATTKPFGAYSMDALRRSGRRYALVHVAEYY